MVIVVNKPMAVLLLGTFLLLLGCVDIGEVEENLSWTQEEVEPVITCRTVVEEVPYVEEVCTNITYTVEECEMKELEYTAGDIRETDLCIEGQGSCEGQDLGSCIDVCSRAMKRCQIEITNNDERYSGTWTVGATFGYNGAAFIKNPESAHILPGDTYNFDFTQIYNLGDHPTMATCSLTVIYSAIVEDCRDVTRTMEECENVTKTKIVETEVCE